ncbi:MAG: hypothetical protein LBE57_01850, partial [Methanosarcinales archaeon]|nr:hypothetical protein [Methanosarcinales archaeon]
MAGLFFLPGLAAANSTEIIPDPGAGGTWTVQWFTVTNQLNLSQPGAPMQTESMRVNAVEFNGVSFTISAFDYPSGTPINQDPSNLWTLMGAQRGVRADQIVVIDINDPLYANGGVINFYFSPPNWEYVPNTGNSTVRVYTPAGWRQVMAATGTTAMTTPMDNRNITTVQLGADIDLRNDQLNGTFNLNRNKQSLTINGLKPGASGSVGSSVNTLAEARSNYFTFVDFFPTTANPLDVNNTTTVPAAGTLNSFTWSNTVIITGSGTGVIYAQGRTGFTQNFNNIFHIGPQLAQANLGQVNLGNTISIIQDPRFHSTAALTSNSFTYIDANGQVQNIILNMGRGTVSYWGSAANASNVTLSGDTHIFRSNRNGTNTSTANVSRHGVFSIFGTAGNLRIADNSNVTIIHNHTHTSNANGLTPLVRAAGGYNIHVGNNSDFSFTNAHHINTNTTAASRPRNIVVGSNSNVDFQSTLINTSTAAAGRVPYLNMSGQMIIGNNSTVNISSPQNRRVPLLVAADNANALNINGGTLNVSGWYNHTGNANIGMVRASNVSINSEGSANLINHATGGPVLHANQVNVNTEGGFVVAGNHGANHLSNI